MTVTSTVTKDTSRLVPTRRELLLSCGATVVAAVFILAIGPQPGDAPAHLYRTFLVEHGIVLWDNLWYAGQYPLASYSLLYYFPAAARRQPPARLRRCRRRHAPVRPDQLSRVGAERALANADLRCARRRPDVHRPLRLHARLRRDASRAAPAAVRQDVARRLLRRADARLQPARLLLPRAHPLRRHRSRAARSTAGSCGSRSALGAIAAFELAMLVLFPTPGHLPVQPLRLRRGHEHLDRRRAARLAGRPRPADRRLLHHLGDSGAASSTSSRPRSATTGRACAPSSSRSC